MLVAAMRDRASVNTVAMRTVSILYNQIMDVGCFSHTLDLVGEHMKTPILDDFIKSWVSLFSHSSKSCLLWRTLTGSSPVSYSATRWWSKFEVMRQLLNMFGDIPSFLSLPHATSSKLFEILNHSSNLKRSLQSLSMQWNHLLWPPTYALEGDGALALITYEQLSMLYSVILTEHYRM